MLRQPLTIIVLLALAFGLAFAFLAVRGMMASPDTSLGVPQVAREAPARPKLQWEIRSLIISGSGISRSKAECSNDENRV